LSDQEAAAVGTFLLIIIGAIFLLGGSLGARSALRLDHEGVRTIGSVVGFTQNRGCRYAEVGYSDRAGTYHQFVAEEGCKTSREAGEKVPVVYAESRPGSASVEGTAWSYPVWFLGLGAGMWAASAALIGYLVLSKRKTLQGGVRR
jgi:hypothetical protein